jgi:hypothetical protein
MFAKFLAVRSTLFAWDTIPSDTEVGYRDWFSDLDIYCVSARARVNEKKLATIECFSD